MVDFIGKFSPRATRDLLITMPNIEDLLLEGSEVSSVLLHLYPLLFPSLRCLRLRWSTSQTDGGWAPLMTYLTHQTSSGQTLSLRICGRRDPIPPEVAREMGDLVEVFNLD